MQKQHSILLQARSPPWSPAENLHCQKQAKISSAEMSPRAPGSILLSDESDGRKKEAPRAQHISERLPTPTVSTSNCHQSSQIFNDFQMFHDFPSVGGLSKTFKQMTKIPHSLQRRTPLSGLDCVGHGHGMSTTFYNQTHHRIPSPTC